MERIEEERQDLPYHQYQHFLSRSTWSWEAVITKVGIDVDDLMRNEKSKQEKLLTSSEAYRSYTGFIVDESSHVKKGKHSVGVARQYAGSVGKIENCQVGVYASLVNGNRASLIKERLFLPKSWVDDKKRCKKAGIPEDFQLYKSKPLLALDMIDEALAEGLSFDWVGGDGLYGHHYELGKGLDDRGLLFVLDIHKDQRVYLESPKIYLPEAKTGRGRKPSRYKTDTPSTRVDGYLNSLLKEGRGAKDWQKVRIRKTTKGWLNAWVHCKTVWVWNKKEEKARKRTLIIRQTIDKNGKVSDTKYSLSNGSLEEYSPKAFVYFQAQRYWVERNFDDGKNELGLSDYQVRKWKGWHHHHAIVLMAMFFMLKEQVDQEKSYPLMSLADARKMVVSFISETIEEQYHEQKSKVQIQLENMNKRHYRRKKSIDWHFKNDDS